MLDEGFAKNMKVQPLIFITLISSLCITFNAWGNDMDIIKKWKKAVIHLECVRDDDKIIDLFIKKDKKEITEEQFTEGYREMSGSVRFHGTAIFLIHNERRYLITAQHVVYNDKPVFWESEEYPDDDLKDLSGVEREERIKERLKFLKKMAPLRIFGRIFRVPSLDEFMINPKEYLTHPKWSIGDTYGLISKDNSIGFNLLMNLGAGPPSMAPYTFLDPQLSFDDVQKDIAIISLDQRNSEFADELIRKGYEPISMTDIADEPLSEGVEIFSVGYPEATSVIDGLQKSENLAAWSSSDVSAPVFSFGRVAMLSKHLDYFWSDISIYPGNSGGPIVENGKLVGIVSAQPHIEIERVEISRSDSSVVEGEEKEEVLVTRIPFGKIIKAKYIAELLSMQEKKDRSWPQLPSPHNH